MRSYIFPLIFILNIAFLTVGCEGEQKTCRCMVKSNIEDAPDPLFDIVYIDEEEDCSSLDNTETVFPQDADPGDTTVFPTVWVTTCSERLDAFPEED